MVAASIPSGTGTQRTEYAYDWRNWRVSATTSQVPAAPATPTVLHSQQFAWGMDGVVAETLGDGSWATYTHAAGMVAGVGGQRVGHDALGSVVGRVNAGTLQTSSFDAWGNYLSGAPQPGAPSPGFAGQSWDADSTLSYAQQRWYKPGVGRFLSEDPTGVTVTRLRSGQDLDGFTYTAGAPTRYVDKDGRWINIAVGAGIGAGAGCALAVWNAAPGARWAACAKGAAIGGLAGAVAGATFGLSLAATGAVGIGGTAIGAAGATTGSVLIAGTAAGASAGAVGSAGNVLINGGSLEQAKEAAAIGAFTGAASGALGTAAGVGVGGFVASQTGSNLLAGTAAGAAAGLTADATSQIISISGGMQNRFSGGQLALAGALGGIVGAGYGAKQDLDTLGESAADGFARGMEEGAATIEPEPAVFDSRPAVRHNKINGDAARDRIARREAPSLTEQNMTTVGGSRRIDVRKLGDLRIGIESKVGRTGLTPRVRQELARDWWLRRQDRLDEVWWEFSRSLATGKSGPAPALADKLNKLGFKILGDLE